MDIVKVNPFNSVPTTGKATAVWIPPYPCSLFGFILERGGGSFTESMLTNITVRAGAGGKKLFPGITGARYIDIYEYEGQIVDSAYTFVLFGDPTARTMAGKHLGNFDHTIYPGNMVLEIDITGATTPTLNAYAMLMPPKLLMGVGYTQSDAELHRALIETVIQTSAAVTDKAFDIGLGSEAGALLKKLCFFHTTITDITVKKSGFDIYEKIPIALSASLQDDLLTRLPQSGLTVYDAIADGDYSELKTTIKPDGTPYNYQVKLSDSAGDTVTCVADVLTKLPLL